MLSKLFPSQKAPTGPVEYMIVGLGNPGKQYEGTRHNTGFMTIDHIAEQAGARIDRLKFKGLCGEAEISGKKVLLLKPSTFMNLSGQSVQEAMNFYKLPPENVLIIFDDISLEPGHLRIRKKGSDGGHNGMKNIIYLAGKDTFPRIKMGVGAKPNPQWDLADWVLSRFSQQETSALNEAIEHAASAAALIVSGEIEQAMNQYNS
jgi:PTH1 family peptidyl-tRNA hydrolase